MRLFVAILNRYDLYHRFLGKIVINLKCKMLIGVYMRWQMEQANLPEKGGYDNGHQTDRHKRLLRFPVQRTVRRQVQAE